MESKNENKEIASDKKGSGTKSAALIGITLLTAVVIVGTFYLLVTKNQIYTDKAEIEAPSIAIASQQGGTLQKVLVKEGDTVEANTIVAQVANQILETKNSGIVVSADNNIGQTLNPGQPAITLIDPKELRVIAHVDEDKGLDQIKKGQQVSFTVDAFGGKKYSGVVEEVSPSARQSGVVFNISDQREVRQFDVKIRFDINRYPELKNGMSAKVTIYKN